MTIKYTDHLPHISVEPASASELKAAKDTKVLQSPLIACNTLFLVIFMCLAEKHVVSCSQPAQLLEGMRVEMPEGPDRAWLTQVINSLWNFERQFGRHTIH